ncbi:retrotransposon protein, putative, ty1-copia subclass [Tanacetum coccineum]
MTPATTERRWVIGRGTGFNEARKLKQRALYLYVGNGVRAQLEAIGSFDSVLPNGLMICLDNCHYAPSITRGVVSVHRFVEYGFVQCFTDLGILVSKNNVVYFNAIPSNGIYEIDLHDLVPNVNSIYNVFKNKVENQLGKTIKALRPDQGGEYISQEFKDYLKACGIVQQLTPPYTPQHNGVSERRNRTLLDMVRSMMNLTTLLTIPKREVTEQMTETMEEYMCKTRGDYGSGVTWPKIDAKDHFELKAISQRTT